MDLRGRNVPKDTLDALKALVIRGKFGYQPFVFNETFETGVGYEFEQNHYAGLVYFPDIAPQHLQSPSIRRLIFDDAINLPSYRAANQRLRQLYDYFVDVICDAVGDVASSSFLDVGCNTGYFPLSFSLRGASWAAGCDREDFSEVFSLLNGVLGTKAQFIRTHYDPAVHTIPRAKPVDAVFSSAVLCHTSDPLQHLATLGALSRKVLFVWTILNDDPGYTIHFGEPRGDYPQDSFPICFDNKVCPSLSLVKRSFALMGFREVREVPALDSGMPEYSWHGYRFRGVLGIR